MADIVATTGIAATTAMRSSRILFPILFLLFGVLTGCREEGCVILNEYRSLPTDGWDSQNALVFDVDTVSHTADYALSVGVRTTHNILFQKIYVALKQQYHHPQFSRCDTLEVELTDPMGNLRGEGVCLYTTQAVLSRAIRLRKGQWGTVSLVQIMRCNQLPGITDVGLEIRRKD